jgi:hypothetical protein
MAASDSTSRRLTAERRELKRVSLHGNNHAFVEVAPKAMLTAADLNERIADASMISYGKQTAINSLKLEEHQSRLLKEGSGEEQDILI